MAHRDTAAGVIAVVETLVGSQQESRVVEKSVGVKSSKRRESQQATALVSYMEGRCNRNNKVVAVAVHGKGAPKLVGRVSRKTRLQQTKTSGSRRYVASWQAECRHSCPAHLNQFRQQIASMYDYELLPW